MAQAKAYTNPQCYYSGQPSDLTFDFERSDKNYLLVPMTLTGQGDGLKYKIDTKCVHDLLSPISD